MTICAWVITVGLALVLAGISGVVVAIAKGGAPWYVVVGMGSLMVAGWLAYLKLFALMVQGK